uniref:Phytoene desaturase 2 n=1 Tax=Bixa orellana TaxID=66672 RepID=A0A9Y0ZFS2_BIXOR|nr:phytoene desaturase 2 [Bixa orellana]
MLAVAGSFAPTPLRFLSNRNSNRGWFCCRASESSSVQQAHANEDDSNKNKKKVVVVGSGWAGLGV